MKSYWVMIKGRIINTSEIQSIILVDGPEKGKYCRLEVDNKYMDVYVNPRTMLAFLNRPSKFGYVLE